MHIIENHYLGLALKNPARIHVLQDTAAFAATAYKEAVGELDGASSRLILDYILLFLLNPHTANYVFTETAKEVLNRIKVSEVVDVDILRTLPENQTLFFNFLYDKDRVIYCRWNNEELYIVDLQRHAAKEGLKREVALISLTAGPTRFTQPIVDALKCLIFLKLTAPEIIHLAAGKKHGTRKQGHYNATSLPVVIVDSTWNKYIVRTDGFGVAGHFRLQRWGKGNADLKLTWIKPYQKHGYVRLPKTDSSAPAAT